MNKKSIQALDQLAGTSGKNISDIGISFKEMCQAILILSKKPIKIYFKISPICPNDNFFKIILENGRDVIFFHPEMKERIELLFNKIQIKLIPLPTEDLVKAALFTSLSDKRPESKYHVFWDCLAYFLNNDNKNGKE